MGPDRHVRYVRSSDGGGGEASGTVAGVVLAGGGSTRFSDGDKALATIRGAPILVRVATTLRRATGRSPVVAVRTDEQRSTYRELLPPDVAFVDDAAAFSGPLAGVVAAAEATTADWLFVCGCDMPLLSEAAVRWVVERARAGDDAVAVRNPDGTVEPLHACYRRSAVLAARDRLPRAGGVRALFDALDATRVDSPDDAPADVPLAASLSNVNTRADLDAIRERTSTRSDDP